MIKKIKQMMFTPECDKNELTHKTTLGSIQVHPLTHTPTKVWKQLRTEYRVEKLRQLYPYPPVRKDFVRFVCIGDTHMRHEERHTDLSSMIPPGDVLLHVGDFTMYGSRGELYTFNQHYGSLPHKVKLLIAGNHDSCLEPVRKQTSFWGQPVMNSQETLQENRDMLTNFTYLQDAMVEVYGIKIYGAPWVPVCHSDAFTLQRGMPLLRRWDLIPEDTDILMTHGPPVGYGDTLHNGRSVGCVELLNTVRNRVRPKFHVYGHVHEGYGMYTDGQTVFVNAAMCTKGYRPVQAPIIFDFPLPKGHSKSELVDLSVIESVMQFTPDESEEIHEVTEGKAAEVRRDTTKEVRRDTMATDVRQETNKDVTWDTMATDVRWDNMPAEVRWNTIPAQVRLDALATEVRL
ncbi:UPF0046 protein C25E10.12-like [Haliotis asinina]|uniref:UPF0046 protein C25E10.12-like n=1 Tax=Haliotis asinina TaxID=109174 RepID=UPI00353267ED